MTRQRAAILAELRRRTDHPTADELYAEVRRRLPRISLGTVYRNLERLAAEGAIHKLCPAGRSRFDADTTDHCHVRCLGCGRVDDIEGEPPPDLRGAFRDRTGYEIVGHHVELLGWCPRCRRER